MRKNFLMTLAAILIAGASFASTPEVISTPSIKGDCECCEKGKSCDEDCKHECEKQKAKASKKKKKGCCAHAKADGKKGHHCKHHHAMKEKKDKE